MKQVHTPLKLMIAGVLATAAFAIIGPSALAQSTTTATPTPSPATTSTTTRTPRTEATPEMIEEAIQRSKARREKFLATGKPEQFGSEEPFTPTPRR